MLWVAQCSSLPPALSATISIYRDEQGSQFVIMLPNDRVVLLDSARGSVGEQFQLPAWISQDLPGGEYHYLPLTIIPHAGLGIISIWGETKQCAYKPLERRLVRKGDAIFCPRWYYPRGDKTMVVVGIKDESLLAIDAVSLKEEHRWSFRRARRTFDAIEALHIGLSFHPDGLIAAVGGERKGSVIVWSLSDQRELWRARLAHPDLFFKFTKDGATVLVKNEDTLEVRNAKEGDVLGKLAGAFGCETIRPIPDPTGRYVLCSPGGRYRLSLWDWKRNQIVVNYKIKLPTVVTTERLEGFPLAALFSPDGKRLVVLNGDLLVDEFDTASGNLLVERQVGRAGEFGKDIRARLYTD